MNGMTGIIMTYSQYSQNSFNSKFISTQKLIKSFSFNSLKFLMRTKKLFKY